MPKTNGPEAFKAYKAKVKWCNKIDKADASCFGIGVQYIVKSHVDRENQSARNKIFLCLVRHSDFVWTKFMKSTILFIYVQTVLKHMKKLPNGETKKNIVDILLGNVI